MVLLLWWKDILSLLGDVKKQLAFIGEFFISIFELTLVILFIFCVSIFISLVFNFFLIFSLFLIYLKNNLCLIGVLLLSEKEYPL